MAIRWLDEEPPPPQEPVRKSKIRWLDDEPAPAMPQNMAVLGGGQVGESREDKLRREAHEDIIAGMGAWEKRALGADRGITRLGQSIKQMALHSLTEDNPILKASKFILPDKGDANIDAILAATGFPKVAADYDRQLQEERSAWDLGAGKDFDVNAGDFLGTLTATLPLGGPSAKGGTILANMGKNALIGGTVSGLTTPVDNGEDFAVAKAKQTALGGAVSGATSGLLQGAGKLIEEIPGGNLLRRGYNALANRANAKPAAAEGEALAKQFGVELTPGQVSGGKGQLAVENMARQSIFTRDKVFETDMKIADQYADAINKTLDKISTKGGDAVNAGRALKESVDTAVDRLQKARERVAAHDYAAVEQAAGSSAKLVPEAYAQALKDLAAKNTKTLLGNNADTAQLARSMEEMLSKVTGQKVTKSAPQDALSSALGKRAPPQTSTTEQIVMPQSIGDLVKTRRNLMQVAGGQAALTGASGQPIQKQAAVELVKAIDNDLEKAAQSGTNVGNLLARANSRYRAYSQRIEGIQKGPLGRLLGDDLVDKTGQGFGSVAPEQIFDRFSKMSPDHVRVALKAMSPEATAQVKRAYVQKALEAAQQPTATGGATQASIRPTTFVASLQRNPEDKRRIAALFTPDERKELDALMSVGRRIGDRTGANTSETAVMSQTMGILEKLRSGTLRGLAEVGGAALGTREIARIMADSGGRKALMELRRLPPSSARARDLAAYIGGLAAAKEYDE